MSISKDGIHNWNYHAHVQWLRNANLVMQRVERDPVTPSNIVVFFEKIVG